MGFVDGAAAEAEVVGSDADLDLAVIKVALSSLSADTRAAIAVAEFGDSSALKVGNQVVAIGNALGYGQSVTTGIVSAVERSVTTGTDDAGEPVTSTYIQTDAAINPGNSGGALLNMDGELVGINSAKVSSEEVEGMGYAIPGDQVRSVISAMIPPPPLRQRGDLSGPERHERALCTGKSTRGRCGAAAPGAQLSIGKSKETQEGFLRY